MVGLSLIQPMIPADKTEIEKAALMDGLFECFIMI